MQQEALGLPLVELTLVDLLPLVEEAIAFPLSLALEEDGFRLVGGEMGIVTGEEGLIGDFDVVAIDGRAHWFGRRPQW